MVSLAPVARPIRNALARIARELENGLNPFTEEALTAITGRPFGLQETLPYWRGRIRGGVSERARDLIAQYNAPGSRMRRSIAGAIEEGRRRGTRADKWWDTYPLLRAMAAHDSEAYGPLAGPGMALRRHQRWARVVGDTSSTVNPDMNLKRASLFHNAHERGEEVPFSATEAGSEYGALSNLNQRKALAATRAGGPLNVRRAPKTSSMGANVAGNHAGNVTIDRHALRQLLIRQDRPNPDWLRGPTITYDSEGGKVFSNPSADYANDPSVLDEAMASDIGALFEERPSIHSEYAPILDHIYTPAARAQGLTPAQAQAAMWPGGDRSLMRVLADRVAATMARTGKSFEETLREVVANRQQLYGLGGGAGLMAALRAALAERQNQTA